MEDLMNLVHTVCQEENLKVTVSGAVRNSSAAATGCFLGCLLFGGWGGVPGAAAGAAIAAALGGNFKPLWQVINEWPQESREALVNTIQETLRLNNADDPAALAGLAIGAAAAVKEQVALVIIDYCQNVMNVNVQRRR